MLPSEELKRPAPTPSVPVEPIGAHRMRHHPMKGWQYFSHEHERWTTLGHGPICEPLPGDVRVSYEDTKSEPEEL